MYDFESNDNERLTFQSHVKANLEDAYVSTESNMFNGLVWSKNSWQFTIQLSTLRALKRSVDSWDDLLLYSIDFELDIIRKKEKESASFN